MVTGVLGDEGATDLLYNEVSDHITKGRRKIFVLEHFHLSQHITEIVAVCQYCAISMGQG